MALPQVQPELVMPLAVILVLLVVFRVAFRSFIYDAIIVNMTARWYEEVLRRLPANTRLLDVGIGTGTALVRNADLLRSKGIHCVGVDYDLDYVKTCERLFTSKRLSSLCSVRHASIYDFHEGGPYSAAYFSGSLMIMPDPAAALRHVRSLLAPDAPIYLTQTFEHRRRPLVAIFKRVARFFTGIDFGSVTYEPTFLRTAKEAGERVVLSECISGTSRSDARSFRLIELRSQQ